MTKHSIIPAHENNIHRPANLQLMRVSDKSIINTHTMPLEQLMSYGNEISDAINESSPDKLAFEIAKKIKNPSIVNAVITLGDLMQVLNDEYLYRMFNDNKSQYYKIINNI